MIKHDRKVVSYAQRAEVPNGLWLSHKSSSDTEAAADITEGEKSRDQALSSHATSQPKAQLQCAASTRTSGDGIM
jgi:hypothetical protein